MIIELAKQSVAMLVIFLCIIFITFIVIAIVIALKDTLEKMEYARLKKLKSKAKQNEH